MGAEHGRTRGTDPRADADPRSLGRGLAALTFAGLAVSVGRDLRHVRQVARLQPPSPVIDVVVHPRHGGASVGDHAPRRDTHGGGPTRSHRRMVALGDSSIAGIGADDVRGCLAVQTAQHAADAVGDPVHVLGLGVSGARTGDVLQQARVLDPADPPDVLLVVVGANDIAHITSPWRYARDVRDLYTGLHDLLGAPVVACSLPQMRAMTIVGAPLREAAVTHGRLLGLLQRRVIEPIPGVTHVDARAEAGPGFLSDPATISPDGYHPSTRGYALLAASLGPAVVRALGD